MNVLNTTAVKATVQLGAAASTTYAVCSIVPSAVALGGGSLFFTVLAVHMALVLVILASCMAALAAGVAYERYASSEACERHGEKLGALLGKARNLFSRA